jgi:hypothetical protein
MTRGAFVGLVEIELQIAILHFIAGNVLSAVLAGDNLGSIFIPGSAPLSVIAAIEATLVGESLVAHIKRSDIKAFVTLAHTTLASACLAGRALCSA